MAAPYFTPRIHHTRVAEISSDNSFYQLPYINRTDTFHFVGFEPGVHLSDNFIAMRNIDDAVKSLEPNLVVQMSKL